MHIESGYPVDVAELARWTSGLMAAGQPVLTVRSAAICFSLQQPHGGLRAEHLPAGFSALEMHTGDLTIQRREGSPRPEDPLEECAAGAARELCLVLADAPSSYRRFSLRCHAVITLFIHILEHDDRPAARQGRLARVQAEELAEHLQDCAGAHMMGFALVEDFNSCSVTMVLRRDS